MESPDDLLVALQRDPEELVGQPERQWLEFKGLPYRLGKDESDWPKFELAKDVSAMANAGGGVIVLGVATEKRSDLQEEVAIELRPIPDGLVDKQRMANVIRDWVYPPPEVHIHQHTVPGKNGVLWTIHVERQRERDSPFLLAKEFRDDKGDATRDLFGLYERRGTHNHTRSPQQLHQWIRIGYRDGIVGVGRAPLDIAQSRRAVREPENDLQAAERALQEDVEALALVPNGAYLAVQFQPSKGIQLERFFEGDQESLHDSLRSLRKIRPLGFNLPWRAPVERIARGGYRLLIRHHSSLSVSPSGLTTAVMGQELLTWAHQGYSPKRGTDGFAEIYINPLSIPEYVLEACIFLFAEVKPRAERDAAFQWRVAMSGVEQGIPLKLPKYSFGMHRAEPEVEDGKDFCEEWKALEVNDPERLAFLIVHAVYRHFHLGEAFIMYREDGRISAKLIASGMRACDF